MGTEFINKRIAIVGCAQGLGRSIAMGCLSAGAELLLFDINPEVESLTSEIQKAGGKAACRIMDVCDVPSIKKLFEELIGKDGLSGLIYTPRGRETRDFVEFNLKNWDLELNIALRGAFFCAQAAVPLLAKKKTSYPFIINISSVLSQMVGSESVGYHVAKAGIDNLTRYLAVKLGFLGIRVNAIQLGWFIKDIHNEKFYSEENRDIRELAEGSNPLNRVGTSEDLLDAILFLGSRKAKFITGQILCIDGGSTIQEPSYILRSFKNNTGQKGYRHDH